MSYSRLHELSERDLSDSESRIERNVEGLTDATPGASIRTLKRDLLRLLGSVSRDGEMGLPSAFACGPDPDEPASEGLDGDNRPQRMTEVETRSSELIRSALREALRDEEEAHAACRERVEDLELELRETRAAYEVALDSERVAAAQARHRARKLERASPNADVFEDYERRLDASQRRGAALATRNVELELRLSARLDGLAENLRLHGDQGVSAALVLQHSAEARAKSKVCKHLEKSVQGLRDDNADLRAKMRRLAVVERVARTQSRVAASRGGEAARARTQLDRERRRRDADRAELEAARRDLELQRSRNEGLVQDRRDVVSKLKTLRDYVKALPVYNTDAHEPPPPPSASHKPKFHIDKRIDGYSIPRGAALF
ncbi:hypothetical protein M885DRAFT_536919 [Pelagophyceae sp. CCMP2097]|nr:hypothetical protein M885DRAFT_536919 [Pelagophyceae sp. CCMP2097]